jgi:hypothetical protein
MRSLPTETNVWALCGEAPKDMHTTDTVDWRDDMTRWADGEESEVDRLGPRRAAGEKAWRKQTPDQAEAKVKDRAKFNGILKSISGLCVF